MEKKMSRLLKKKRLSEKFWWFELGFEDDYEFEAGQYVSVRVNEKGDRRAYSIASVPGGRKIGLLLDVSPEGVGSKFFLNLEVGDEVEVMGPLGRFVVQEPESKPFIFVATGSGVAPMRSMIEDLLKNKDCGEEIKLVWGLRFEEDVFWKKELEELERKYKNFEFSLVLSKPGKSWEGKEGRVTDLLEEVEGVCSYNIYICGRNEMVDDCMKKVIGKGVDEKDVYFEKYG